MPSPVYTRAGANRDKKTGGKPGEPTPGPKEFHSSKQLVSNIRKRKSRLQRLDEELFGR